MVTITIENVSYAARMGERGGIKRTFKNIPADKELIIGRDDSDSGSEGKTSVADFAKYDSARNKINLFDGSSRISRGHLKVTFIPSIHRAVFAEEGQNKMAQRTDSGTLEPFTQISSPIYSRKVELGDYVIEVDQW